MKVVHLYPHTKNVGDHFVSNGIQKLIREFINDVEFTDLPTSSTSYKGKETRIFGGITLETVDFLNSFDLIVIGGSNLYETINSNQFEISVDALKKICRPILLIGIGGGWSSLSPQFPLMSKEVQTKLALLNAKSCGSSVRDHFTFRYLKTNNVGEVEVTGCPSASLFEKDLTPVKNKTVFITGLPYRMYTKKTLNPSIALWRTSYRRQRQLTLGYTKLLNLLSHEGINYKIYITDSRDIEVVEKIIGRTKRVIFDENPEILLSALDECDVLIGYRLHACIPALSKGIPIIPLPLDGRVLSFIETYGLTEYYVNPYDPGQDTLVLEKVKLALGDKRIAWNETVVNRNQIASKMRGFLERSLSIIK